ncbi:MAG: hypothetical protein V3V84_07455 [Candidatus Bathyarchaeia archaeon]
MDKRGSQKLFEITTKPAVIDEARIYASRFRFGIKMKKTKIDPQRDNNSPILNTSEAIGSDGFKPMLAREDAILK